MADFIAIEEINNHTDKIVQKAINTDSEGLPLNLLIGKLTSKIEDITEYTNAGDYNFKIPYGVESLTITACGGGGGGAAGTGGGGGGGGQAIVDQVFDVSNKNLQTIKFIVGTAGATATHGGSTVLSD